MPSRVSSDFDYAMTGEQLYIRVGGEGTMLWDNQASSGGWVGEHHAPEMGKAETALGLDCKYGGCRLK